MIPPLKLWVCKHPAFAPDVQYVALCNLPADAKLNEWAHLTAAELEQWKLADLADGWVPLPPLPAPTEETTPARWRVSKDTLISRVVSAGRLPEVMAALAAQSPENQFLWNQSAWFWSDNAQLRGMCTALSVDADALLAPDPFLTD